MQEFLVISLISYIQTTLVSEYYISSNRKLTSAQPNLKKVLFDHITKTGRGITGDKWTATDQSFSAMLLCCGFHFLLPPKGIFATQGM